MEGVSLSPQPTWPALRTDCPPHSAWGACSLRSTHAALGTEVHARSPGDHHPHMGASEPRGAPGNRSGASGVGPCGWDGLG